MKRIALIVACLLIGAGGGYGIGYVLYTPVITSYANQISSLTSEVAGLKQTVSTQEIQISELMSKAAGLSKTVSNQESQISTLQSEKSKLQSDLTEAQNQTQFYKGRTTTLSSEMSSLRGQMNKVLGITVRQQYHWTYNWQTWQWDLPISLAIYVEYSERVRPLLGASYVNMAKDTDDDIYIDKMVQQINSAAMKAGYTEFQKINFVIAFVQSLPYTVDNETKPYDEYPRYPLETLFDRGGDCEDTSILVAALLDRMGYDVALLWLENAKHIAVGVSVPGTYGSYYTHGSKKYYYLETTGEGWQIGQIPPSITDTTAHIYPLRG